MGIYTGELRSTPTAGSAIALGQEKPDYSDETIGETVTRYADSLEAHFAEDNLISKGLEATYRLGERIGEQVFMLQEGVKYDRYFNPFDYVTEPQYNDYADRFLDCKSQQQVDLVKMQINEELKHRDNMSKVGMGINLAQGFLANAADPTNLVPFSKAAKFIKGTGVIKGAARGAIVGGASNLTQEFFLKELSATYTDEEFAQNLVLGTAISGGLGAIIGGFGKAVAKDSLDIARKDIFDDKFIETKSKLVDDLNNNSMGKNLELEGDLDSVVGDKGSIGAAKAPEISVKDDNLLAKGLIKAQAKLDPILSMYTSVNGETRAVVSELSSTSVIMNKTQRVDTIDNVKNEKTDEIAAVNQNNKMLYRQYYNDSTDIGLKERIAHYLPARLGGIDPAAKGKMTPSEFNEAITECVESGFERHKDNRYIVEAAKNVVEVNKKNAVIMDRLHDEGKVSVKSIKNYMPRGFSATKVAADPEGFVQALVNRFSKLREFYTKDLPTFKNDLSQAEKNLATDEDFVKERRAEIERLNNERCRAQIPMYQTEGEIHRLEKEIEKKFREYSKTNERILKVSPDLDFKPGDREFAHQIKFGLPKHLRAKSLSEMIRSANILIDDVGGKFGKEADFTLQNYKKSDVNSYDIRTLDEFTEYLWEQGWYRERPYLDDMVTDIIDDMNGAVRKYHENDAKYLRREYEIDEARETLGRLGYSWERMSPEQIDNVLSNLGDKATLRNKIAKAREIELNRMSGQQKAELARLQKDLEYQRQKLEGLNERFNQYSDELAGLRAARDKAIDDIKEGKKKIKRLTSIIKSKEQLANARPEDLEKMARDERARLVTGKEAGGLDFEVGETGGLLSRQLLSGEIEKDLDAFLEKDATILLNNARKEFVDLTLIDRFGTVGLSEQKAKINAKYDAYEKQLSIQKSINGVDTVKIDKLLKKAQDSRKNDLENLDVTLSRLRETNFANNKYPEWANTFLTNFKAYNILTSLGQIVLSSVMDVGGVIAKNNMRSVFNSIPAVKRFASLSVQEQLRQYPWLSHGIVETFSNTRGLSFAEITANNPFENRSMRFARATVDVFMNVSGAKLWNKFGKVLTGFSHISRLRDIAEEFANNRKLSDADWEWLRRYGIDSPSELREINIGFKRYGSKGEADGVDVPNFMLWKNQELAKKLKYGVDKAMDEAIVTPGLDRAKAFDDPLLGLVLQFKQFAVSSMGKTLIPGLQSADRYVVLEGMATMVGLGMLSVMAKNALAGREPLEPGEIFMRGFAASGVTGWLEEPYKLTNALTHGGMDRLWYAVSGGYLGKETVSPYETQREMESFLGPWWGKIKNIQAIVGDISRGKINRNTARKIKRSIPFQNVPIVSQAADAMVNNLMDE